MLDIECIKFPECLGCEKVIKMYWENTGAYVRVCRTYRAPRHWWRGSGCPIKIYEPVEIGSHYKKKFGVYKKDKMIYNKKGRFVS